MIEWHLKSKKKPIKGQYKILIYSPLLGENEKYRLVEVQFLRTCSDATHWAYVNEPLEIRIDRRRKEIRDQFKGLKIIDGKD